MVQTERATNKLKCEFVSNCEPALTAVPCELATNYFQFPTPCAPYIHVHHDQPLTIGPCTCMFDFKQGCPNEMTGGLEQQVFLS